MSALMDKLAKLMEMARRGTEHEAENASRLMAELMAKHQIEAIEIEEHAKGKTEARPEKGRVDDEEHADPSIRMQAWQGSLLMGIAEGLGGQAWRVPGRDKRYIFMMVGPPGMVNAARYLYMALEKEIGRRGRQQMRERVETNAWRRAYCAGMVTRVRLRLKEGRQQVMQNAGTAMVLVQRMDVAIKKTVEDMGLKAGRGGKRFKREEAQVTGYRDGADLDLSDTDRARLDAGKKGLTP